MKPTEAHLELLHFLDHLPYESAVRSLRDQDNALQTAFQCTLNGWVSRGALTSLGRSFLGPGKPIKTNIYEIVDLGPGSPSGGADHG